MEGESASKLTELSPPTARRSARTPDAAAPGRRAAALAIDETVTLLHPPLPLVGAPIVTERERQQNDSLVNG